MSVLHSIIGPIARSGLTALSRRRLPQLDGTITVAGLTSPVEILRDKWGVPHLYAKTSHDIHFAQGYVHAQDRLWQMELNRRTAQGRLSEVFGDLALETDRISRTFGFNRLALQDYEKGSQALHACLEAYSAGVNAFLESAQGKLPVEFFLLKFAPEEWKPVDSLAFGRVMIWQLSHAWYGEIIRAKITEKVGPAHAAELEINYPEANPITLPFPGSNTINYC